MEKKKSTKAAGKPATDTGKKATNCKVTELNDEAAAKKAKRSAAAVKAADTRRRNKATAQNVETKKVETEVKPAPEPVETKKVETEVKPAPEPAPKPVETKKVETKVDTIGNEIPNTDMGPMQKNVALLPETEVETKAEKPVETKPVILGNPTPEHGKDEAKTEPKKEKRGISPWWLLLLIPLIWLAWLTWFRPVPAPVNLTAEPTATAIPATAEPIIVPPATTEPTAEPIIVPPATTEPIAIPALTAGWVHNPTLGALKGYPGWMQMLGQQQSDGLARLVELTLRQNEIALIFGDQAAIDPIGNVGGQLNDGTAISGCYLVVVEGPFVWDTQPATGEYPPFFWSGRSAWDAHVTDGSASPLVWAAQKVADLQTSYPETCGKGVDLWVFTQP
jgi:hypothetical protein